MAEGGEEIPMERFGGDDWDVDELPSVPITAPQEPGDWIPHLQNLVRNGEKEAASKKAGERWIQAVKEAAKTKGNGFQFKSPPNGIDYKKLFSVNKNGALYLLKPNSEDEYVRLTDFNDPTKFRSLKSVAKDLGEGAAYYLRLLGLVFRRLGVLPRGSLSPKQVSALKTANVEADAFLQAEGGTISHGDDSQEMNAFIASLADPVLKNSGTQTSGLPLRELEGLDKALQSIRGTIAIQEAKRVEYAKDVKRYEEKLEFSRGNAAPPEVIEDYTKKLDEAWNGLEAAESSLKNLRGQAHNQVQSVKDLIGRVLREDTSLASKLREIFREQGITITAIITALGAIIAALVEGLTGGGSSAGAEGGGSSSGGDGGDKPRSAVKRAFDAMAKGLRWLAGKAAAALPGIIGSVVSFLLRGVAAVATWLGSNTWALLVLVGV